MKVFLRQEGLIAAPLRFFLLLLVFGTCIGCRHQVTLQKTNVLGPVNEGTIVAETWLGNSPMEQPIWRVCLIPKNSTNLQALFTVEAVFQESEPGYPNLLLNNDVQVIQDSGKSYIYSLSSRDFITNRWPGSAYLGNLRTRH